MTDPTVFRRRNVLALFQAYAESAVATGAAPKGLEQAFAAHVEISPSMWSQIKSSRPIGDKLARQIEQHFLALALQAWRASNAEGRKALKAQMRQLAQG